MFGLVDLWFLGVAVWLCLIVLRRCGFSFAFGNDVFVMVFVCSA